jgi:hypothetical protein
VDILELHLDIDTRSFEKTGVRGAMNINGHTTLVLDILEMAESFLERIL